MLDRTWRLFAALLTHQMTDKSPNQNNDHKDDNLIQYSGFKVSSSIDIRTMSSVYFMDAFGCGYSVQIGQDIRPALSLEVSIRNKRILYGWSRCLNICSRISCAVFKPDSKSVSEFTYRALQVQIQQIVTFRLRVCRY